jgi:hypothetical protein
MQPRLAAPIGSLVLIVACGMAGSPVPGGTPSPVGSGRPTASPVPSAPAVGGSPAQIEIEVIGGEYEGSYRAEGVNACRSEPAQNTFTVSYTDESASTDFAALHVVLRDATQAREDASSNFLAEIGLDGAANITSFTVDPTAGLGEGDAFLDITDFDATVELSAIAADDSLIDLTVICDLT